MLGTILSVMGGINTGFDFYRNVGTLVKGDSAERVLEALSCIHEQVVQLNDKIWYAPCVRGLTDVTHPDHAVADLRAARELLDPVQRAVSDTIVSSGLTKIPHMMQERLSADPWKVLIDIRPHNLAARAPNSDAVPVMFVHAGVRYIGWQMRGALPILFGCHVHDLPGITPLSEMTPISKMPAQQIRDRIRALDAEIAEMTDRRAKRISKMPQETVAERRDYLRALEAEIADLQERRAQRTLWKHAEDHGNYERFFDFYPRIKR